MNDNFDYSVSADLYSSPDAASNGVQRHLHFASSARAIQFALEELPQTLLFGTTLVADRKAFRGKAIIGLYMAVAYPFARALT
ncbi:hypothetical protein [Paradevosia shaoguanensis]|uniref:Uncharacterized protein n=1 Tax=Paradevosia shaoguanensis TaxID=1335043 RepID=A0AA41QJB8_9HYPH|nr:hypothetical protein [Paradevosia shaoguanensis]MCF1740723.1 hypothetical protein [Paradevosia shaoguanensis]MCI0125207.1 hypothetical protein [Paradevosia shaoguanensis]